MGLNSNTMAAAITNAVLGVSVDSGTLGDLLTSAQRAQVLDQWELICAEIVDHITQNAVVTVQMQTHTHSGVSSGASSSGPPISADETGTVS